MHLQLNQMTNAFDQALAQAASYAVRDDKSRAQMATLLMAQYVGLRVLVRSNAPQTTIEACRTALRSVLLGWP